MIMAHTYEGMRNGRTNFFMSFSAVTLVFGLIAAGISACASGEKGACSPNAENVCICNSGQRSTQLCGQDGVWGECSCGTNLGSDSTFRDTDTGTDDSTDSTNRLSATDGVNNSNVKDSASSTEMKYDSDSVSIQGEDLVL